MLKKLLVSSLILLAAAGYAGAQSPGSPEALNGGEKAKAMRELQDKALALLNEVIKDLASLHSAENRVHTLMIAAESLWKHDEKRARLLFSEATGMLAEQIARLKEDDSEFEFRSQRLSHLRHQYIQIAERLDPVLALDFLNATRHHIQGLEEYDGEQSREASLRLRVARQALEKDPELSLKIAEESLESGFFYEINDIIQQLYHKDKKACEKLVSAFLGKLRGVDIVSTPNAMRVAAFLLNAAVEGKRRAEQPQDQAGDNAAPFRLSEKATAELMEMVVKAAIGTASGDGFLQRLRPGYGQHVSHILQRLVPEIEKYSPMEAKALAGKLEEYRRAGGNSTSLWLKYNNIESTGSLDDYLKAIEQAPQEMRSNLYQQAANRAMNDGDAERARQIISQKITNPNLRRNLLSNIERDLLRRAADEGKVEEARRMVPNIGQKEEQATILADLAMKASANGDKKTALQLIDEAWSLMSSVAESYSQMQAQLHIATASASLDPGRSFEIIEQNIDRFNQIIAAASILNGFDIHQYFSEGEMSLWAGNQMVGTLNQFLVQLGALARADFNRARTAADRFERFEAQVMARLHVARGALSAPEADSTSGAVKPVAALRGIRIL